MNYKLINLRIETASGNRISGNDDEYAGKYFCADAINPYDNFEPTHRVVTFNPAIVRKYANLLPKSLGGNLADSENWAEDRIDSFDRILTNGVTIDYDLGGTYYRKYTSDIIDANGNPVPGKHKDDPIRNRAGRIKTWSRIPIFCRFAIDMDPVWDENGMPALDEHGNPKQKPRVNPDGSYSQHWVQGWDPNSIGERMKDLMFPYTDAVAAKDLADAPTKEKQAENSAAANLENADALFAAAKEKEGAPAAEQAQ